MLAIHFVLRNRKKINFKLFFLSLIFNNSVVWGHTLEDEIKQLVLSHPEIIAQKHQVKIADAEVDVALSNYYPDLSAFGQTGYQNYQDTGRSVSSELRHTRYRFELTQNLFKGLQDKSAVEGAGANRSLRQWSTLKIENDLIEHGISTYLDVLQYHKELTFISNKVNVLKRTVALKKQSQLSGSGTTINVLEAKLSLQRAQEQKLQIDGKYRYAFRQYQIIFEHDPILGAMAMPAKPVVVPQSLEQALQMSKVNNAQLAMAEQRINIAEHEKAGALGKYSPELDIVTSYERETNFQGIEGNKTDMSAFVRLTWDFNLGNKVGDQYRSASGKLSSEKYSYYAANREVNEKIKLAWEKQSLVQRRLQLSNDTIKIAEDIYQARNNQMLRGGGNEIALLNAKSQLLEAKISSARATYDALKSTYELLHSIGLLHVAYHPG